MPLTPVKKEIKKINQALIKAQLAEVGITPEYLAVHAKLGLEAERDIISDDGDSICRVPDWPSRHKYFQTLINLFKDDILSPDERIPKTLIQIFHHYSTDLALAAVKTPPKINHIDEASTDDGPD